MNDLYASLRRMFFPYDFSMGNPEQLVRSDVVDREIGKITIYSKDMAESYDINEDSSVQYVLDVLEDIGIFDYEEEVDS